MVKTLIFFVVFVSTMNGAELISCTKIYVIGFAMLWSHSVDIIVFSQGNNGINRMSIISQMSSEGPCEETLASKGQNVTRVGLLDVSHIFFMKYQLLALYFSVSSVRNVNTLFSAFALYHHCMCDIWSFSFYHRYASGVHLRGCGSKFWCWNSSTKAFYWDNVWEIQGRRVAEVHSLLRLRD